MRGPYPFCRVWGALGFAVLITGASAEEIEQRSLKPDGISGVQIVEGTIKGEEIVDYAVQGEAFQILSVDLKSENFSAYFNILRDDAEEALFIGSTRGNVADVPLPESGAYVIRLYLERAAAHRGETTSYSLAVGFNPPEFADGLSGGPDYWEVSGADGGGLDLRAGPSSRYAEASTLRNGDVLENRGCRLTGDVRWCEIRATGSGVTGWVAGRYLVETAPPQAAAIPDGGPTGNGAPFDATGFVPCATDVGQPMRPCPFGVIREGPGNAGVWIALGDGTERQILFEGGAPVATGPAADLSFEKTGDRTNVQVADERYEIPDAVVHGG
jgi:hypothetical protein